MQFHLYFVLKSLVICTNVRTSFRGEGVLRIALRVLYPTSSSLGGLVQYIELLSAVSVPSTLQQIFNFFETTKFYGIFSVTITKISIFHAVFGISSLGHLSAAIPPN